MKVCSTYKRLRTETKTREHERNSKDRSIFLYSLDIRAIFAHLVEDLQSLTVSRLRLGNLLRTNSIKMTRFYVKHNLECLLIGLPT